MFDSVLAQVEVVNCKSVKLQCLGTAPIVQIDKTDGITIYLSKESLEANIITSKSSEMNLNIPTDDDDYVSSFVLN